MLRASYFTLVYTQTRTCTHFEMYETCWPISSCKRFTKYSYVPLQLCRKVFIVNLKLHNLCCMQTMSTFCFLYRVAVFVRRPGPSFGTTWDTYMAPFSNKLWMAVLCAIFGLSFGLTVTLSIGYRIGIEKNDKTTQLSLYDSVIYIFGSICQQGMSLIVPRKSALPNLRSSF